MYPDFSTALARYEQEKVPRSVTEAVTKDANVNLRSENDQLGGGQAPQTARENDGLLDSTLDPVLPLWENRKKTEVELRDDLRSLFTRDDKIKIEGRLAVANECITVTRMNNRGTADEKRKIQQAWNAEDNELLFMSTTYIATLLRGRQQMQQDHDDELVKEHPQLAHQRLAARLGRAAAGEERKLFDEESRPSKTKDRHCGESEKFLEQSESCSRQSEIGLKRKGQPQRSKRSQRRDCGAPERGQDGESVLLHASSYGKLSLNVRIEHATFFASSALVAAFSFP